MPIIKRPTFVGWIALAAQLPLQLFLTVWVGGFFGGMFSALAGLRGHGTYEFFGVAAFVGVPCVAYFGKKLNYANTTYTFYDDRLEFEEGFFSQNRKVVRYQDVLEVSLRKGLLQRSCNLGTVYLGTLATGSGPRSNPFYALGFGNVSASGVGIRDVADPEAIYRLVQQLVDGSKISRD